MELGWPKIRNGRRIYDTGWLENSCDKDEANLSKDIIALSSQDLPDFMRSPLCLRLLSFRRQFSLTKKGYIALAVLDTHTPWWCCLCVFGCRDTSCIEGGWRWCVLWEMQTYWPSVCAWLGEWRLFMASEHERERLVIRRNQAHWILMIYWIGWMRFECLSKESSGAGATFDIRNRSHFFEQYHVNIQGTAFFNNNNK